MDETKEQFEKTINIDKNMFLQLVKLHELYVSSDSLSSILTDGGVKIGKTLGVNGCITVKGTSDFKGSVNIKSDCTVDGNSIFNGNTIINSDTLLTGNFKCCKTDGQFDFNSKTRFLNTSDESVHVYGSIIIDKSCKIDNLKVNNIVIKNDLKTSGDVSCGSLISSGNLSATDTYLKSCTIESQIISNSLSTGIIKGTSCLLSGDIVASNCNLKNIECNEIISKGSLNVKGCVYSSGSLKVEGKVSIEQNASVNGYIDVKRDSIFHGQLEIEKDVIVGGDLKVIGNVDLQKNLVIEKGCIVKQQLKIDDTTDSINYNSGALVIKGGIGLEKNLFVHGSCSIDKEVYFYSGLSVFGKTVYSNTAESTSPSSGSMILSGGMGIMQSLNVGKNTTIENSLNVKGLCELDTIVVSSTEDCVSFNSGGLIVKGGICIKKSLICGGDTLFTKGTKTIGQVLVSNNQDSSSYQTGALCVDGGVGIGKSVYINETLFVKGNTSITGSLDTTSGIIKCKNINISDVNGLLTINSDIVSGLRVCGNNELKKSRYYTCFDLFSLGNVYTDTNVEALQISNNDHGDYSIVTRSLGNGKTGNLSLKSGYLGGSVEITSGGDVILSGSRIILSNNSKTVEITLIIPETPQNDSQEEQEEPVNYTLTLPKTAPPKGVKSILVCDENGQLVWMEHPF
jgi:cytoskeletal protein CcmA (bactofilin family)